MSAAQRYSPKELEFYLIDFKSTGFEPFERYRLPHVKVVANHADREFGLNILKKLVDEQARRMRMRDRNESYPRTILIIDECQDFFPRTNDYNSDDDIVAQEATSILEFLLKKGREFNINIIIATQELASKTSQIPETLYKNMAIRYIASPKEDDYGEMFKRSENEAMAIKRDYGKGEALFVTNTYMNPECSYDEYHTKAFWIENNELDELITQLANYAAQHKDQCPTDMDLFVFHNDADLVDFNAQRRMLKEHLAAAQQAPESIPMYLGQPIAMENDVYLSLATTKVKKQNVLIVGSVPTDAPIGQSIAYNALLSSTKAYPTDQEHRTLDRVDYVFDFTQNGDSFEISGPPFSLESEVIDNDEDAVKAKLTEINEELEIRKDDKTRLTPHIFLTFLGFERGDMFEAEEEASELLNTILEKGSKYGIFTIIQTVSDESSLQEQLGFEWQKHFNHVVALQMDSDTSCTLIKNRSAASLYKPLEVDINHGLYRALYFNAYSNTITKFKPYKF